MSTDTAAVSRIPESENVPIPGLAQPGAPRLSLILICRSYPPVLGGSEIEAQRVCAALIRRGHRIKVLCAGGAPMPDLKSWTDPLGVPVRIIGGRVPSPLRDYAFAIGVVWTLIREWRRFDIAYFLMQGIHLAAGLPVARLLRKPIVMKVSGSSIITLMGKHWLGRLELRFLRNWASRVMVLNPGIEQEAIQAGLTRSQLAWMPNPVDHEQFAPCGADERRAIRRALSVPEQARVILFVGRLAPEKELPSLLRAFAETRARHSGTLLVLIGDGPERTGLEELANQLRVGEAIRFAGRLEIAEVVRWLRAGDVFALVSSNEGFPCSLLEAMSAGLSTVVSDIPANTQMVEHMVTGLYARTGDPASIAQALDRLLGDERLRGIMGAAARQRVAGAYSTEQVIKRYEQLFFDVLHTPGAGAPKKSERGLSAAPDERAG